MIQLDITLPNGTQAGCHILDFIQTRKPFDYLRLTVQSYVTVEAYMAGAPYVLTEDYSMPAEGVAGSPDQAALEWLIAPTNPFAGGELLNDESGSLEAAQDRTWARIKRARTAAELANFECDGRIYDADKEHISGGVLVAKIASDAGLPFSSEFTLANDEEFTLDAAQMIAVGMALTAHVEAAYARGRQKRRAVYAATTIAQLDAITWYSEESN